MKRTLVFLAYAFSITIFAFADSSTTLPITQAHTIDDVGENWGQVCSDQQIYDLCDKFLIKQFGEKWAKHYTIYRDPKGIQRTGLIHSKHQFDFEVSYGFSGPANLPPVKSASTDINGRVITGIGPELTFFMDDVSPDGCGQLKLWLGSFFIAPYDASKLITAKNAERIAKQKGYDVHFSNLKLIPMEQMLGRVFLTVPGYAGDCGADFIEVNAVDGTLRRQMRSMPL